MPEVCGDIFVNSLIFLNKYDQRTGVDRGEVFHLLTGLGENHRSVYCYCIIRTERYLVLSVSDD